MRLERTEVNLPDPKYWAGVANMLIMVMVIMKVVRKEEVDQISLWLQDFLAEI